MLDDHVLDAVVDGRGLLLLVGHLGVRVEEEGEAREEAQLALDLHPAGRAYETPRVIPLLDRVQARAQRLEPYVQHLLVEADAEESAQLGVESRLDGRVVADVDELDRAEEQLVGRQHLAVLVESKRLAQDEARVDALEVLLDDLGGRLLDKRPRMRGAAEHVPLLEAVLEYALHCPEELLAYELAKRLAHRLVAGLRVRLAVALVDERHELGGEPALAAVELANPAVVVLGREHGDDVVLAEAELVLLVLVEVEERLGSLGQPPIRHVYVVLVVAQVRVDRVVDAQIEGAVRVRIVCAKVVDDFDDDGAQVEQHLRLHDVLHLELFEVVAAAHVADVAHAAAVVRVCVVRVVVVVVILVVRHERAECANETDAILWTMTAMQ